MQRFETEQHGSLPGLFASPACDLGGTFIGAAPQAGKACWEESGDGKKKENFE